MITVQDILKLSITDNINDIEEKIENIEVLCNIGSLKNMFLTSQQKLQHIILKHFEITENEKDKIKCSEFLNKLETIDSVPDKKVLNTVLNQLQVQKKRFTNGYYWSKIKEK